MIKMIRFFCYSAGGLLIGQLDRVQFYESLPGNHYRPHILPLDGKFQIR